VRGNVVLVAALLGLALAPAARGQERPAVVVTQPGAKSYRAAIQQFAPGGQANVARIHDELAAALDGSGVFTSLDPAAFLGPRETRSLDGGPPVVCPDWRQSGADALVQGEVTSDAPSNLAVEFQVWDVVRCRVLLRKRYRGGPGDERRIARRIADDVVAAFTGTPGVASTEIAFVSTRSGSPQIFVMDSDGANVRAATNNHSINGFPDWSPRGDALLYMSYLFRRSPHLFLLVRGAGARGGRLLTSLDPATAVYRGVYDPKGERIAVVISAEGPSEIYVVDADGRNLRRLTRDSAIDVSPSWSPDGRQIAFVSDRTGSPQVYVMDSDGRNARRVTFDGSYNTSPAWSPDGRWIAYAARVGGQFDIWVIDPDGQVNVPLVSHPRSDEAPTWSPDSRKIAFQSTRRGTSDIYSVDLDGANLRRLTEGQGENTSPTWGPYPR
jgi:TolB protein